MHLQPLFFAIQIRKYIKILNSIICSDRSSFQDVPIKAVNYVKQDPIGVAALICPWNLPLYLASFDKNLQFKFRII